MPLPGGLYLSFIRAEVRGGGAVAPAEANEEVEADRLRGRMLAWFPHFRDFFLHEGVIEPRAGDGERPIFVYARDPTAPVGKRLRQRQRYGFPQYQDRPPINLLFVGECHYQLLVDRNPGGGPDAAPSSSAAGASSQHPKIACDLVQCKYCKEHGHLIGNCEKRPCMRCGKPGHWASDCGPRKTYFPLARTQLEREGGAFVAEYRMHGFFPVTKRGRRGENFTGPLSTSACTAFAAPADVRRRPPAPSPRRHLRLDHRRHHEALNSPCFVAGARQAPF